MSKKPEWTPENSGPEFASFVNKGVKNPHKNKPKTTKSAEVMDSQHYTEAVLNGDRVALARAITFIESNSAKHHQVADDILSGLIEHSGNSIRIGISGAPGVGKSSFIDSFGTMLCRLGHQVAVLAVDPSSSISRGAILGDKTRMENLSKESNAFIRPSASGSTLGGVAKKTREAVIACEAAGFDIILIETVGVGQSEITVRSMVDFFLLLISPGGGDELQGIKKGTVEIADALVINKCDGDNMKLAEITQSQYRQALHYIRQATEGWDTQVLTVSSIEERGLSEVWDLIQLFVDNTKKSDVFAQRRKSQLLNWFHALLVDELMKTFYQNKKIESDIIEMEQSITDSKISVSAAVKRLIEIYNTR